MLNSKKIVCVLPAFNAYKTLEKTLSDVPQGIVDLYILVDDGSTDQTVQEAQRLSSDFPLKIIRHEENRGYGANQKTCYKEALQENADVIVMLHPDYQYEPKLLGALASLVTSGVYDIALGSRILGGQALKGGMPLYKYISNRFLTAFENIMLGQKLSEYHTGYRAFSRIVIESIDLEINSDDFIFDNQILIQAHLAGFKIGEISVPAKYFPEASSINLKRSLSYGLAVVYCSIECFLFRVGIRIPDKYRLFLRSKTSV